MSESTKLQSSAGGAPQPELKRVLGLWALVAFGVGDILGAGVYALIGKVAGQAGSAAWMSYLVAGVLALLTGFTYAELGSRFPKAGGAAHYVQEIYRNRFATFLIIFFVVLSGLFAIATSSHTFAQYALHFMDDPGILQSTVLPIAFLCVVGFVAARGVELSSIANIVCFCVELTALLIIIGLGIRFIGGVDYFEFPTPAEGADLGKTTLVLGGAITAFFAFIGFEDMANLAEETKDASRTLPLAIMIAIGITTSLYLLIALIAVSVVPFEELKASSAPLILVLQRAAPWFPAQVYSIMPAFAVFNTGLVVIIMASRLLYGMSRGAGAQLPRALSYVHPRWRTPVLALLAAGGVVLLMILSTSKIEVLADGTTIFILIVFAMLHVALIIAKRNNLGGPPRFSVPVIAPALGTVLSLALLGSQSFKDFKMFFYLAIGGVVLFGVNWFFLGRRTVEAVD